MSSWKQEKTYKITTKIKTYYGPNGCKEDFRIAIGQGQTAGDMTNVLREEKDSLQMNITTLRHLKTLLRLRRQVFTIME